MIIKGFEILENLRNFSNSEENDIQTNLVCTARPATPLNSFTIWNQRSGIICHFAMQTRGYSFASL